MVFIEPPPICKFQTQPTIYWVLSTWIENILNYFFSVDELRAKFDSRGSKFAGFKAAATGGSAAGAATHDANKQSFSHFLRQNNQSPDVQNHLKVCFCLTWKNYGHLGVLRSRLACLVQMMYETKMLRLFRWPLQMVTQLQIATWQRANNLGNWSIICLILIVRLPRCIWQGTRTRLI